MISLLLGLRQCCGRQRLLVFVLANCMTGITWSLVMPYLLGLASVFDSTGRAAAALWPARSIDQATRSSS